MGGIKLSSDGKYIYSNDLFRRGVDDYLDITEFNHKGQFLPRDFIIDEQSSRIIYATCNQWDEANRIRMFDLETLSPLPSVYSDYCLQQIRISPDGNYIAISGSENKVDYTDYLLLLLDSEFNLIKEVYRDSSISVSDMKFTSDSESLFFTAGDFYTFNINDEEPVKRTEGRGYSSFEINDTDEYFVAFYNSKISVLNPEDLMEIKKVEFPTSSIWDIDKDNNFVSGASYNLRYMNIDLLLSVEPNINSKFNFRLYQNHTSIDLSDQSGLWNITLIDILGNVYYNQIHRGGENIGVPYSEIQSPYLLLILDNNGERSVIKIFRGE